MKRYIYYLLIGSALLSSCEAIQRKEQLGAAVEINGCFLYYSTLDSLTLGLNSEDSIRVAQQYISSWAKDILFYTESKVRTNPSIERLVEDYRRSLYVHAYEEYLVEQDMPKTILDSTITHVYTQMSSNLILDESIAKGLLLVYPLDAPKTTQLKQWCNRVVTSEDLASTELDQIEKYAYQNASGYELFTDRWLTTSEIAKFIPIEHAELEKSMLKHNQMEYSDSSQTYLLQLTSKYLKGETMPIDYASPMIQKLILNQRQLEFLQKERERIYNEAVQNKKIVFYEK